MAQKWYCRAAKIVVNQARSVTSASRAWKFLLLWQNTPLMLLAHIATTSRIELGLSPLVINTKVGIGTARVQN